MQDLIKPAYTIFLLLLIAGCKVPHSIQSIPDQKIPSSFTYLADTSGVAQIQWREFFADSILVALIEEGIKSNFDVNIALQRIEQARSNVIFRKGAAFPTVAVGGTAAIRRYGLYTMDGAGNATTEILPNQIVPVNLPDYLTGFQANWEVDVTGKLRNRSRAATARYLASVEGRNWLITNLVADIATAYYELIALDQELSIIKSTIDLQQSAFEVVSLQKEHGATSELVVNQFEAQLLGTRSLAYEVNQQMAVLENYINTLLGRFPTAVNRNPVMFEGQFMPRLSHGVPSELLRNRPDVRSAELELTASKADFKAARAAFFPSLDITSGVGFQAFRTDLLFTSPQSFIFNLAGSVSAPLLNRTAIKAELNAANAAQIEALYNYQRSILMAFYEVSNEIYNLSNLEQIIDQRRRQVDVFARAIENSTELYKTGRANYLEVIITQQNALAAKLDLVDVRKRQLISQVMLYKSLGGGWQ